MSDPEVILVAVAAGKIFRGNSSRSCLCLKKQNYCPNMLSKSRFNRRLHQLLEELWIEIMRAFCPEKPDQKSIASLFLPAGCRRDIGWSYFMKTIFWDIMRLISRGTQDFSHSDHGKGKLSITDDLSRE